MTSRKSLGSGASTRLGLRTTDLQSPDAAARNLNDVLKEIQLRLEGVGRSKFVDVVVVTDGAASPSPVSIAAPPWPVRGVFLARAWNATTGATAPYVRIGWRQDGAVLTVAPWGSDVVASTRYDLTLEVRG